MGLFLSALLPLDELEGLDLGELNQFDGGTLIFAGTWTPGEGTLQLDFRRVGGRIFGNLPIEIPSISASWPMRPCTCWVDAHAKRRWRFGFVPCPFCCVIC